jgi:hypothetical protein
MGLVSLTGGLNKACDSIRRSVLCSGLFEFGSSTKLVGLIKMCNNKSYTEVRISRHLHHALPFQNDLKRRDALSPLLQNLLCIVQFGRFKQTRETETIWDTSVPFLR